MIRRTIEVLPLQEQLISCTSLFSAAVGGVGAGKTLPAQIKMWVRMQQYPLAGHYVVGADFEQLRGGYMLDFRELMEEFFGWRESRDYRYREHPRPEIQFTSGARLRTLSAELAERMRSTRIQSLHAEEPQTWHNGERAWGTLVGRMRHSLRSSRAYPGMPIQAWMTLNPIGCPSGSWLHRMLTEQWPAHGYPVWRFSLRENTMLENHEQVVANLEATLPPSLWPVEIDGFWPTSGGGAYREYDAAVHAAPAPAGLPPMGLRNERLCWSLDFNVGLQCSVIAQPYVQPVTVHHHDIGKAEVERPVPTWQRRTFYIIDELAIEDAGAEDVVRVFLERYGAHAKQYGVTVYGDASGGARSALASARSSIRTNWQAIVYGLRAANVDVRTRIQAANPPQGDRINMVNRQLRSGDGYGLLVDPKCVELIADLVGVNIKPGTNEIDKSDTSELGRRRTHASDALGYMIYVERMLETSPRSITFAMIR